MSYRKINDFIHQISCKNEDGKVERLLGVNLDKVFIPSVANLNGVDMTKYKIIKKGQFGCKLMSVGRDKKLPISRLVDFDKAIISSAYFVFEVKDESKLLPEYLMMWFRRPESDRFLWFLSGGDIRGRITWEDLCTLPIKIPSIEKQRAIVKEYNTVVNRIKLNEELNRKLEETAQAIYKQYFVEGVDLENLPKGWEISTLNELVDIIDGDRGSNYPSIEEKTNSGYCLFLNAGNVTKIGFDFSVKKFISKEKDESLRKGKLKRNDVVLTSRGTVGNVAFYSDAILVNHIRINSGMVILRAKDFPESTIFIYSMLRNSEMKKVIANYLSGSAQPQLPIKDLIKIPILKPCKESIIEFSKLTM